MMNENAVHSTFNRLYHTHKLSTREVSRAARILLNDESFLDVPDITLLERLRAVLKHDNLPEVTYNHIMQYCPVDALVDKEHQVLAYLISHPCLTLYSFRQLLLRSDFVQIEDIYNAVKGQKEDAAYRMTYPIIFSRIIQRPDPQERTHTLREHVQAQHFYRTLLRCEHQAEVMMSRLGMLTEPEWK